MEEWLNEVLLILQDMLENGEEIPDALFAEIANAIEEINQTEQAPIELPNAPPAPEVTQGEHPSSNIEGFKYSPEKKELLIQFHGPYPQAKGPIYSYQNVPAYIYDVVSRGSVGPRTTGANRYHSWQKGVTPSLGASVYALIKNAGYPYERVA